MTDTRAAERPKAKKRQLRKIDAKLRARIEQAVEQLIATLDATGGDEDHEDGGDDELTGDEEPSLGSIEVHPSPGFYRTVGEAYGLISQVQWAAGNDDDCEGDSVGEDDEANGDDEPSLGSLESHPMAGDVGVIMRDRIEGLTGGGERRQGGDQSRWGSSDSSDLEDEHDGREPEEDDQNLGSFDRLMNQVDSWTVRNVGWFPGQDLEVDQTR